jgi:hypothetical protein
MQLVAARPVSIVRLHARLQDLYPLNAIWRDPEPVTADTPIALAITRAEARKAELVAHIGYLDRVIAGPEATRPYATTYATAQRKRAQAMVKRVDVEIASLRRRQ